MDPGYSAPLLRNTYSTMAVVVDVDLELHLMPPKHPVSSSFLEFFFLHLDSRLKW
jgi:hypothetical protein